jgi:phosphatidylglycerophosphate synthase
LSLDEAVARLLAVASERVISQTEEVPTLQAWGRVLIWASAVLTIWSMVYYLKKALPEIRARAR